MSSCYKSRISGHHADFMFSEERTRMQYLEWVVMTTGFGSSSVGMPPEFEMSTFQQTASYTIIVKRFTGCNSIISNLCLDPVFNLASANRKRQSTRSNLNRDTVCVENIYTSLDVLYGKA